MKVKRLVLNKLLMLFLIVVLAFLFSLFANFKPLSFVPNPMTLQAPDGKVVVYRDQYGIPHITAQKSIDDVYYALGYVHAQDRLWQMIFQKHVARGTLSEIFGKKTLLEDEYLRTWGFFRAAQAAWPALDKTTQQAVRSYTAGVNAYIAKGHLPLQFKLLGYTPKRWTVIDSIAWQKMLAWDLQNDWQEKLKNYLLAKNYTLYGVHYFRPSYPKDAPTVLSERDLKQMHLTLAAFTRRAPTRHLLTSLAGLQGQVSFSEKIRHQLGFDDAPGKGSNNWVVSGRLTKSGKPLLANDLHLKLQAPALWYLAELKAPHYHVVGGTVPGLPGVIVGHNDHIAWGVTSAEVDTQDLYILPKDAKLKKRQEIINVKNGKPVHYTVLLSAYGPVISTVEPRMKKLPFKLAIRWVALQPGDTTVESFAKLAVAKNWHDFVAALKYFVTPSQNFVYADTKGNIGYYLPGKIPIRDGWTGLLPVRPDEGFNWQGYIPFDELPHVYNPPEGYIISANNKIVPDSYPYRLTSRWHVVPYRAERIKQLLLGHGPITLKQFERMQLDTHSLFWEAIKPVLMKAKPLDAASKRALRILAAWDGNMARDSIGATVFEFWRRQLATLVPKPVRFGSRWIEPLFLIKQLKLYREQRFLSTSLQKAMQRLYAALGKDSADWQWGKIHRAVFNELALGKVKAIAWIWNRQIATAGGDYTLNVGTFDPSNWQQIVGPSYRQIIDLGNLKNSKFIQTLGQSGNPANKNYSNQMPMWRDGLYAPMG